MKSITQTTPEGDAEAICVGKADTGQADWEINYPWGSKRFYGTLSEARKEMSKDIAAYESEILTHYLGRGNVQ